MYCIRHSVSNEWPGKRETGGGGGGGGGGGERDNEGSGREGGIQRGGVHGLRGERERWQGLGVRESKEARCEWSRGGVRID